MILETERLTLRPFDESDAESVYEYAKDPDVGPVAGWPVHSSVENSREIILNVLAVPETYAICLKPNNIAIGAVGLMIANSNMALKENEAEVGYWLGKPFWGQGFMPEAVRELIRHAFEDLNIETLWCGYFDGNEKSKRAQEKCGFIYHHTNRDIYWKLMDDIRTEHITVLAKEDWEKVPEKAGFIPTGNAGAEGPIFARNAKTAVIYIHGKNGSAAEAEHYKPLFPNDTVIGFEYKSETPWESQKEFSDYFDSVSAGFDKIRLIANSIGAFFSLCSLNNKRIEKAFFISPIVNMEKLICDMMAWASVTEDELQAKKEIPTAFGETLSWEYLKWVRNHPVKWSIPTEILYGEKDKLQSIDTLNSFAKSCGAGITVMGSGEHWFHTEMQMAFLDEWIKSKQG